MSLQPESRECFIQWEDLRTSGPGDSISRGPGRLLRGGGGRSQDIQKLVTKEGRQSEHQRLLLIKENQKSLPCMGRCKSLGIIEVIPFICISAIWGQHRVF